MKKDKHITINLTEVEYNALIKVAEYTRRSISEIASLILIDNMMALFLEYQSNDPLLKPSCYIPTKKQ